MKSQIEKRPVRPSQEEIDSALNSYILSASGWRSIFARSKDPESSEKTVDQTDLYITSLMAESFFSYLRDQTGKESEKLHILVARDTRPTGTAIARRIITTLTALDADISYNDIAPAPEVMAYCELSSLYDGFVYITASHNPQGYNGLKFGRGGSVLNGTESQKLLELFLALKNSPITQAAAEKPMPAVSAKSVQAVFEQAPQIKEQSLDAYRMFIGSVAAGSHFICGQDQIYNTIRSYANHFGLGVLADFNGSARSVSIDEDLLCSIGVSFRKINAEPGVFAHRIVPEGESLRSCSQALEKAYSEDPSFLIGYVPDCDGDRGNIVYIQEDTGKAAILEAQQVFALAVLSELAFVTSKSMPDSDKPKLAVAVNGPTSMRIDAIARSFGAETFRAEVGEAHAVALAENLRLKGYEVRILGEGSNGGNITHPARVRDPINTVISLLKLLSFRKHSDAEGLFELWCRVSKQPEAYKEHFSLQDVINSLPRYVTTSAYEQRAVMSCQTTDQEALKSRYEQLFKQYWENHPNFFSKLGITSWKEFNTAGTDETEGTGFCARKKSASGGLKIAFYNDADELTDYIWFRGSKTEPVLRILADCLGDDVEREEILLKVHKDLIKQADRSCSKA
ncbi:MAG: hypothetical protein PF495_11495 [Spirochaetales bacterium]|jgi:phosphoglucomutase|nr:hypothetical protein [Spirochaetales bacterium]